ncbi:hypothetical protein OUZ56_008835 [Daphnia magna]|uniref:Uncharacterized protein n=1 Tax=Daphnia magna TaxID=35525 RepID=A0ABR0AEB1_9CRUS|nr:hypothetical protein OUZ56_008835 [Daphnia magna]
MDVELDEYRPNGCAYSTPSYNKDNKYADIIITSQSDERILDGSSQWSVFHILFCLRNLTRNVNLCHKEPQRFASLFGAV